jgi:N-acetylglucosaminyldiphosphoundecaprenol N-acetyl-beta-D-mannosaminyltransferase
MYPLAVQNEVSEYCMQALPTTPAHRNLHWIMGLPFDAISLHEAVDVVRNAAKQRTSLFISTPNLNFLIASQDDAAFRDSVINSDLSLADGMPIVWLAKLLKVPIKERVAGASLFEALRYNSLQPGEPRMRVFFFGGPDGVAERACQAINQDSTSMECVGYHSPGFGSLDQMSTTETLQRINITNADFVVVSLGAKKGQAWIERNRTQLHTPIICHLGAVVNFVAGNIRRAPTWMQRTGLEWLWRIKEEPELWRRYFRDGFRLVHLIAKHYKKKIKLKN